MGVVPGLLGVLLVVVACHSEPVGLLQPNIPGNVNGNRQGSGTPAGGAVNRQVGGLSFAIPGLSLLGGNNAGLGGLGGGNLFGPVTVVRTIVSTVSTVTTASFRTCTTVAMGLMPCVNGAAPAGRRRRRGVREGDVSIEPTAAMALIIGGVTLAEPRLVASYLEAHRPSSQSVIYPPGVHLGRSHQRRTRKLPVDTAEESTTTVLYPSHDTPDEAEDNDPVILSDDFVTTETPELLHDMEDDLATTENPPRNSALEDGAEDEDENDVSDKARVGLGRTTTITSVIRVTSVATTLASGMMATLTVMYTGCLPQSLPVSGTPC